MMRALIRCPNCEKQGRTSVLGELKPTGHFVIQRIYQYKSGVFHKKYTVIGGDDFFVLCDQCGEKVYFKQQERRSNEVFNFGMQWVYRQSLEGTVGTVGTLSSSS